MEQALRLRMLGKDDLFDPQDPAWEVPLRVKMALWQQRLEEQPESERQPRTLHKTSVRSNRFWRTGIARVEGTCGASVAAVLRFHRHILGINTGVALIYVAALPLPRWLSEGGEWQPHSSGAWLLSSYPATAATAPAWLTGYDYGVAHACAACASLALGLSLVVGALLTHMAARPRVAPRSAVAGPAFSYASLFFGAASPSLCDAQQATRAIDDAFALCAPASHRIEAASSLAVRARATDHHRCRACACACRACVARAG